MLAATTACEHKNKKSEPERTTPSGSAAPKPGDETPEPVAKDPNAKQPSPNPAPGGDDVRAPAAADLETYTKDIPGTGKLMATFDTNLGTIHCELFGDKTPITVANFVGLATGKKPWMNPKTGNVEKGKPYYDGLTFHRVIADFSGGAMIQGGDPTGTGAGGPGYDFDDEIVPDLKMGPGVLAMANAGKNRETGGGTNGSQFFMIEGTPSHLNGHHTIFGQCKEIDIIKKIGNVPTTQDRPNDPVVMKSVTISKS